MTHKEKSVRDAEIVTRTRDGQSANEISAAMGVKLGTIYRALREADVVPVKKYRCRSRTVPVVNVVPKKKKRASNARPVESNR